MFRFLAVIWEPAAEQQCAAAKRVLQRIRALRKGWEFIHDLDGLVALQTDSGLGKVPCTLADRSGVILGDMFTGGPTADSTRVASKVDVVRTRQIVSSEGRYLVENYWGSYVGFIRGDGGRNVHVVCAPASDLPCLFLKVGEITVVFSRTEDVLELIGGEFSINWNFVVRFLLHRGDRYIEGTGLNEVSRVLPGECVSISTGTAMRRLYWDAVSIAASNPIEDHKQAVREIRTTTQGCISAWASCHERIALKLSGGLDSSILLHCLVNAPNRPEVQCLNFFTPSAEGDEREYARLVATANDTPLHEMGVDTRRVTLDDSPDLELTSLPSPLLNRLFFGAVESDFVKAHGASAYFTGELGDELFLQGIMEHVAADYVWHHGFSLQLFGIAYHEARVRRLPLWEILLDSLGNRRKTMPLPYYPALLKKNEYLSEEVLASLTPSSLLPAVVRNIDSIPPCKRMQVLLCFPPREYYDPLGDLEQPELVEPLKSQPLLELCFRIPTFVMTAGGVGRALAREAYRNDLPREIIRRRTKGTSTEMHTQALRNNYGVLREMLLDGLLTQEGIVDRKKLERWFARPEALTVENMSQIPLLYGTEAWLRRWASIPTATHAVA